MLKQIKQVKRSGWWKAYPIKKLIHDKFECEEMGPYYLNNIYNIMVAETTVSWQDFWLCHYRFKLQFLNIDITR